MEPKLKAGLWVKAQVRTCDVAMIPIAILRKGDADAGAILLKLSQTRDLEGRLTWMRATGAEPVPEADADTYIERQVGRDRDIWVIEIEDAQGRYEPDAPVV